VKEPTDWKFVIHQDLANRLVHKQLTDPEQQNETDQLEQVDQEAFAFGFQSL
jgi:hypothetical protein